MTDTIESLRAELATEREARQRAEADAAGLRAGLIQVRDEARRLKEARDLAGIWLRRNDAGNRLLALCAEAAAMLREAASVGGYPGLVALAKRLEEAGR